jgi:hypothetical protein
VYFIVPFIRLEAFPLHGCALQMPLLLFSCWRLAFVARCYTILKSEKNNEILKNPKKSAAKSGVR